MLKLKPPFTISSHLAPAVTIGSSTVSLLTYGSDNWLPAKTTCNFVIDTPDWSHNDSDMTTGGAECTIEDAFVNYLGFLSAAAEAYHYGSKSDNYTLFPLHVMEWAYSNGNEIDMLGFEIEETEEDLIEEES